jgi:hypothetical protein
MSGGLSSPFSLVNEGEVRGKNGEQLMEQMEKILLDAAYSFELLKRDVERMRQLLQSTANTANAVAEVIGVDPANPSDTGDISVGVTAHSELTLDDGTNPHSTTKTDVGLANVSNDAQLKIASNLSDLNNAATARNNLGLGATDTVTFGVAIVDSLSSKSDGTLEITVGSFPPGTTDFELRVAGTTSGIFIDKTSLTTTRCALSFGEIRFFDSSTGSAKQTVTGSRDSNAALASLLTALAAYGLVVDSTTET